MTQNLTALAAELSRVDSAIQAAPLFAEPGNPGSSFSPELVELAAREDALVTQLVQQARQATAG